MVKKFLPVLAASVVIGGSANAAILDFTDLQPLNDLSSNAWEGSILGVGYKVSGSGTIKFNESNVGSSCDDTVLACERDGLGIGDDEIRAGGMTISEGQWITVEFDQAVKITDLYFLDLFRGKNQFAGQFEQAAVSFDDATPLTFDAALTAYGGYLATDDGLSITAKMLKFGAFTGDNLKDRGGNNDYALAGIGIAAGTDTTGLTPVPVPAAGHMLLAGLGGLGALRRFKS